MSYHKLLQKQINKFLPEEILKLQEVKNLLSTINDSYNLYERDKELNDRASSISEEEYIEINKQLIEEVTSKKQSIEELKKSFFSISGEQIESNSDDLAVIVNYLVKEIDNRKQTENALILYRKFTEDILNNIPADIAVFDKNHNYIFINPKGVANPEIRNWLIGKNDFDYCSLKNIDIALANIRRQHFNRCVETKSKVEYIDKHRVNESDYQHQYILRNFYPYFENDELKFVIGYGVDISEKVEFERNLTKAILKTQEDERLEIGSELHDNVCQILTGAYMGLSMMKKSDPNINPEWYTYCNENIALALKETRNLSHRLAPAFFEEINFYTSLNKLINNFNAAGKYDFNLLFDDTINSNITNPEIQLNLFRILQEELRNIYKYASADKIGIEIKTENNCILMKTKDNGVGFNINRLEKGNGMLNMKRRVEILHGDIKIISSEGEGCEITIKIPLLA